MSTSHVRDELTVVRQIRRSDALYTNTVSNVFRIIEWEGQGSGDSSPPLSCNTHFDVSRNKIVHIFSAEAVADGPAHTYGTEHRELEVNSLCLRMQILDDWRYIAMVIDRLQLCIFLAVTITGTASILINAPHIFTAR